MFPHMRSLGDPKELEEERRLCYVGITRAMEQLYMTRAWSRNLWGGTNYNPPSRFLNELPEPLTKQVKRSRGRKRVLESTSLSKEPLAADGLGAGDRVRHAHWGDGIIQRVEGAGDHAEAYVAFDGAGVKRLLLAWAPLEKV